MKIWPFRTIVAAPVSDEITEAVPVSEKSKARPDRALAANDRLLTAFIKSSKDIPQSR